MEKILVRSCVTKFTVPHTNPSASVSLKITEGKLSFLNHHGRLHTDLLFHTFSRMMGPNQSSLKTQKPCAVPGIQQCCAALEYQKAAASFLVLGDETQLVSVSAGSTASGASPLTDLLQAWIITGLPTRTCGIPTLQREVQWLVPLGPARRSPVPNADAGRARRQELTPAPHYHATATSLKWVLGSGKLETVPGLGPAVLGPAGAGWILEGRAGNVNPA